MNVSYRIVKVDPSEHGIIVRYFTDKVTEMDLATSFNSDGSVRLNADGYPLSTRTDVFMSIYEVPPPTFNELERMILARTPVDWLKIQENIADKDVDTSLLSLTNYVGDTNSYTDGDVIALYNSRPLDIVSLPESQANTVSDPIISIAPNANGFYLLANAIVEAINAGQTTPLNIK